jgi:DNA transformation protein and related proteins
MQNDLMALKNLGNTSVNWLLAIGIHDRSDLARMGAVEAYNRIRLRGIRVSKVLLYSLHCALHDLHWTELGEMEKQDLFDAAEQALNTEEVA